MRPIFWTSFLCSVSVFFSQILVAQPSVILGISNQPEILWDGSSLVVSSFLSRQIRYGDPKTGTFRPTGAIVDVPGSASGIQGSNSATLLSDGRVLVAGNGVAEIFQP